MSFWLLIQVLVNLVLFAGVVGLWIRLLRPAKDDPRLSKGLQLLQSKISVLEDLSDRTELQVSQLTSLLEQKVKDIQSKIQAADKQLIRIDQSMQKSLEVAKIFQDRIPHSEILERQNTIKYIKAARLAHQGLSIEEIATQVSDLSHGEIEFIAKVNREQLMFCEESLPEWANSPVTPTREMPKDMSQIFEVPKADQMALKKIGDAFKAACEEVKDQEDAAAQTAQNVSALFSATQQMAQTFLSDKPAAKSPPAAQLVREKPVNTNKESIIRPVEFRRLDMVRDLE